MNTVKSIAKMTCQFVAGWYVSSWTTKMVGKLFDQFLGSNKKEE